MPITAIRFDLIDPLPQSPSKPNAVLSFLKIRVRENGTDLTSATVRPSYGTPQQFQLTVGTAGTNIDIDVTIVAPGSLDPSNNALPAVQYLSFSQALVVVDTQLQKKGQKKPSVVQKLVPRQAVSPPDFFPNTNPRVLLEGVSAGTSGVHRIRLDLVFLAADPELADTANAAVDPSRPAAQSEAQTQITFCNQLQVADSCKFRHFIYTRGDPHLWGVLVPASGVKRAAAPCLVFYGPTGKPYTNTRDVEFRSFQRFFGEPASGGPFFQVRFPNGTIVPNRIPAAAFTQQVTGSGKDFVFIFPFGHPAFFDAVDPRMPALVRSLLIALWAGGDIGTTSQSSLKPGPLALSGFSFGGEQMLKLFEQIPDKVSELYVFDPAKGVAAHTNALSKWAAGRQKGGAPRQLRLIAGAFYSQMRQLSDQLQGAGLDVQILPNDPLFWQMPATAGTGLFAFALSAPPGPTGPPALLQFSRVGDTNPTTALTQKTNIRVVSEALDNGKQVNVTLARDAPGGARKTLINICHAEAAWVCEFAAQLKVSMPLPVKNDADFNAVMSALTARLDVTVASVKHQWAVCGGSGPPSAADHGAQFTGHLSACLSGSQALG